MDPAAHITCFIGAVAPLVTGRQQLSILTVYTLRLQRLLTLQGTAVTTCMHHRLQ